jgi:hypothetical protein
MSFYASPVDPNQPPSNTLIIMFAGPSGVGKSYVTNWLFKWFKLNYPELMVQTFVELPEDKRWDPELDVVIIENQRTTLFSSDFKFVRNHGGMVIRLYDDNELPETICSFSELNVFIHNDKKSCMFSDELTTAVNSHRKWFLRLNKQ